MRLNFQADRHLWFTSILFNQ